MASNLSRRGFLTAAAASSSITLAASLPAQAAATKAPQFRYCFNTSTIRGQKLPLAQEVELVGKAGYDGIEPWIGQIETHVKDGGSLSDLRKRIEDAGLKVESAIGFANWIVDDDEKRKQGLEHVKRDMDLVAQIGGTRIAAPPAGATRGGKLDLFKAAERYRALLEVGRQAGVTPQLEVWGFSENLSRLGETALVAIESRHPDACILPDVYHLYKGGSDFTGLELIDGGAIQCFHMNDYPADPPRDSIADRDRVYPGDGVAPLTQILQTLAGTGFSGVLSLELFNPGYWEQDAATVIGTGLAKMKAAVEKAFA
ncbi:TIM barrel protein [bacterium]|nr:TIM barrel protein [bacterium]